jgi:catechol 2,3-dioxygenase-like lactoylglutathione lyase family enzyme
VKVEFIAGFGPIAREGQASLDFWSGLLGIPFEEPAPGYFATDDLAGARAFAIWPLEQAAESTFGGPDWPADVPIPQAWIELDVSTPEAVAEAVAELEAAGCTLLRGAQTEPWGQTTSRLLTPESLLLGVTHTPWMHG